jgi:hypothetical protein
MLARINWFEWGCAALALAGAFLNARQDVAGFYLWAISDAGLIAHNVKIRSYGQATMYLVFLGLCIYGIFYWTPEH